MRQNFLNPPQKTFCAFLMGKKWFGILQNNVHRQNRSFFPSSFQACNTTRPKYLMTQELHSEQACLGTLSEERSNRVIYSLILECQILKYLTVLQQKSNIHPYQRNGWETMCVCCTIFPSAVPPAGAPVVELQHASACFPWLQNYCCGTGELPHLWTDKVTASYFITFWYCTVSLKS